MKIRSIHCCAGLLIPVVLFFGLAGCQKEADIKKENRTIAEWISSDPLYFSILDSSLHLTDLYDTLGTPGPFTLLAPDNSAFGIFNTNEKLDWPFPVSLLHNSMIYHILPGKIEDAGFPSGPNSTIRTLGGDSVYVSRNIRGFFINGIRVRTGVTLCSNGIVYQLERLQIPADGNILQTITGLRSFDSLSKAINRVVSSPGGDPGFATTLGSSVISVFGPDNSAFANWLQSMSLTDINQVSVPLLLSVLRYNMIPGRVFIADLPEGQLQTTGTGSMSIHWTSTAQDFPSIKGNGNGGADVFVLFGNVLCYNGLIHLTDRVLLP